MEPHPECSSWLSPRGAGAPAHSHSNNEEIIYCLEGKLRTSVADEVRDLKPGEGNYTPRGVVHSFSNPHDRVARALVILTPDIGANMPAMSPSLGRVVAHTPRMAAVMSRYGLVLSPPMPAGRAG